MWIVYLLRCHDHSLYTGATNNLPKRIKTHNAGKGGAYTRGRGPVRVVLREAHPSQSSALKREAQIKRLSKKQKEALLKIFRQSKRRN